ncbi:MAG: type I glyceraldehyde-3-phosphate dehydrogenase [Bacilli bacterium]
MIRVAINGFGRIGRCALRLLLNDKEAQVIAINDLADSDSLAYLFKYDSVFKTVRKNVSSNKGAIIIDGQVIKTINETNPELLPWKELKIDVVLECSGVFTNLEGATKHIKAGASKVIISAPSKDNIKTIVYSVNDEILTKDDNIISCASCTTNALAPVLDIINKNFHIEKGFASTVHACTNDQVTLDVIHKKGITSRRGRASGVNIIPTTTGAATQINKIIPSLENLIGGISYRVPVSDGSLINLTLLIKENTTKEEINNLFIKNQNQSLKYTADPIVSSDIVGTVCASTIDGLSTNVIDKNLLNIITWYDNELGYTAQMLRCMKKWIEL